MDMGICVWGACICTCAEARKRHWSSSVAWYVGAEIWTRDCAASNLNHRAISWAPRDLKVILWLFIIFIIILTNLLQGLNCANYLKLNVGAATEKDKYFFLCDCESDMYNMLNWYENNELWRHTPVVIVRAQAVQISRNTLNLNCRRISGGWIKASIPQELVKVSPFLQKESFPLPLAKGT